MPAFPVRAIVLRKTKLGETDVILTLLAHDGRQLRAVAKGMRKPGSRIGARLEPYSEVDLLLHSGRSLDVVTEVETVNTHAALREDFDRSAAAGVVVDILDKIAVEGQAEERLFGLASAALSAMEVAGTTALHALVSAFMLKSMTMHGYRPELESCACCAHEVTGGRLFSLEAGGVLCPQCGEGDGASLHFSQEGRELLERLLGSTMLEIAAADDIDEDSLRDCFLLLRSFVNYHLHARLKALDFYAGMS
ncbi:MAG: DNA repair protein RecO [Coriobacteriia bacterium]